MKIAIRPGTDGALFLGLLAEIERQGLLDVDFINGRTVGFFDAIVAARDRGVPTWSRPSPTCRRRTVRELARLIGSADRCMILHARGPEQQTMGTDNVLAMINVALGVRPHRQAELWHQHADGPTQRPRRTRVGSALQPAPCRPIDRRPPAPCGRGRAVGRRCRRPARSRRDVRRDPADGRSRRDQGPAVDLEQHERVGTRPHPRRRADEHRSNTSW